MNNVDVVLTLYKRPEVLLRQLKAIQNQTIKPRNIYLYQDGIDSYYEINLNSEVREQFTNIKISENNKGVWERFKYASEIVQSEYVCLFDDDTIPGERWLENCLNCMKDIEGIYGTNGILLSPNTNYPYGNDIRIGWHAPNKYIAEVDFVGHAWFLKTEWLLYMFEESDNISRYKKVGEDMYLSFKCLEHGIHTYVPIHSYIDSQSWGSIPKYGMKYGTSSTAICNNSSNYADMNKVLKSLQTRGWKCVAERNMDIYKRSLNSINNKASEIRQIIFEELDSFCEKEKKIYIYGAGKIAKIFFDYLSKKKYFIEAFVVSNLENERKKYYCGRPVVDIQNYNFSLDSKLVVLGIGEFYHEEIRGYFDNIENIQIYPKNDSVIRYDELLGLIAQYIKNDC